MLYEVVKIYIDDKNNELLICRITETKFTLENSPIHRDGFYYKIRTGGKIRHTSKMYDTITECKKYGISELKLFGMHDSWGKSFSQRGV